jgi:hypothetical protein
MKWQDLFSLKKQPKTDEKQETAARAKAEQKTEKPKVSRRRGGWHMSEQEVGRRVKDLWDMMEEASPNFQTGLARRPEIGELAVRLAVVWEFFRSDGFNLKRVRHERALLYELRAIRHRLLWLKWLRTRDIRDDNDWKDAMAWVISDDAEYDAELLHTLSLSAPQRREEPVEQWVDRLRNIRRALGAVPPE